MSRPWKPACFAILLAGLLLAVAGSARRATASARHFTWDTSITYQNIGSAPTRVQVHFYTEGSSQPIIFDPLNNSTLAVGAGRSFFLGQVVDAGYQGNVVFRAEQPLALNAVRYRRFPLPFKVRLLYHGFSANDAASTYAIPTVVLNKWDRTTVFSIQNLETEAIEVTITFYDTDDGGSVAAVATHTIVALSSVQIAMDRPDDTNLVETVQYGNDYVEVARNEFNGSAIITAEKVSNGQPANIIAAVSEYYIDRNIGADFEGVPQSAASGTIYMATALCRSYDIDTYYAVTNVGSIATTATITYYAANGTASGAQTTGTLAPGQKVSIYTCDGVGNNFSGSAVITANSQGALLVALGKAQQQIPPPADPTATQNFSTIFLGEPAGGSRLAFPFIRWANDDYYFYLHNYAHYQRSYLAVRNLESSTIKVNARYYDKDGNLCATEVLTIPQNGKANTSAYSAGATGDENGNAGSCSGLKEGAFGYYLDNTFGGAVLLEAHNDNPTAQFIAINRTQHPGAGEDVNAVPAP